MYLLCDIIRLSFIALSSGLIWHISFFIILSRLGKDTNKRSRIVGKVLVKVLPKAGPAFIKLGQFLSTRPDLVNKEICQELYTMRDRVPPIPFKHILNVLNRSYESDLVQALKIKPEAIASASISQVYKARWNGQDIALKILRPRVKKEFTANLKLMNCVALTITKFFARSKRLKLREIVKVIKHSTEVELDLTMEAAAADRIRQSSLQRNDIYVPQVIWELCTTEVLAMEWIEGTSLTDLHKVEENLSDIAREEIVYKLATAFFYQAYNDGFFHADWHGGNLLITKESKIALLDYGIVSFLPEDDKIFVASIFHAFLKRDYDRVALLHQQAGYIPEVASTKLFALACRSIVEPIIGKEADNISMSGLLKRLFIVTAKFNMETQPQLVLLQKNMIMLEGTIHSIYPKANLWKILEPWLEEWAKSNLSLLATVMRKSQKLCHLFNLSNYLEIIIANKKP